MRISELVKTYRLLNDPEAPAWNVKFVGAIGILGLVALGVGGIYWATAQDGSAAVPAPAALGAADARPDAEDDGAAAPLVAYVGFPPEAPSADPAAVEAALEAWKAAHPGARIVSQEPVRSASGALAGYSLRYLP